MNQENLNKLTSTSDVAALNDLISKIKQWYAYVVSKWLIIAFFGILGGMIGLAYSFFRQPLYLATTTFVLEDEKASGGGLGSLTGLASIAGVDLGGGGGGIFQGDNIFELYKSRKMIEKALLSEVEDNGKKQQLIEYYIDFNQLRKKWAKIKPLKNVDFKSRNSKNHTGYFSRLQDSVLNTIVADINKNYLTVTKPDKKLSIIKAEVKATDEFFAKAFNEEIVSTVNNFYIQTKTKKSLENISILQQKTDSVRSVMNGAIYTAVAVADATPNLNPTRQIQRVAPVQRSQFSVETNRIILSELIKNLEMSKISLRKETPLIQVIDEPVFPLEVNQVGKLKAFTIGMSLFLFFAVLVCTLIVLMKLLFRIK